MLIGNSYILMSVGQTVSSLMSRVTPCDCVDNLTSPKTRYIALLASKDGIILCSFVLTQYRRVTDRRTEML